MSSTVFSIESGVLALSLVGDTDPTTWNAPGGTPVDQVTLADYVTPGPGGDFSCQVTSGALSASPNTSDDTTPATFCAPEVTTTKVGVTSYTLDVSFLQDPNIVAGLNRFLFEHDTKAAYFLLGLDGVNPPKVAGRCRLVAGTIGGDARVTLTADLSLPCDQKPDVEFGDSTASEVVEGGGDVMATTFTAGTPGTVTPANATEPSTFAELTGAAPPVTASPATAWTTGQYVQLPGTSATGDRVSWNGTAWVNSVAAAASAGSTQEVEAPEAMAGSKA
jgi:hypothetical protein